MGKLAERLKSTLKGSSLIVEGEINYRSYENKDGITIYVTEINGQNMHFAGSKPEETPKSNKVQVSSMSDISELPGNVANYDEIPEIKTYHFKYENTCRKVFERLNERILIY